jgi:hypothetical protein
MIIDTQFEIGQVVFVTTDVDQFPRVVTGYNIRPNGLISYIVTLNSVENCFYDFELSDTMNVLAKR